MEPRAPGPAAGPDAMRKILWISFLIAVVLYGVVGYAVLGRTPAAQLLPAWLWPGVAVVFAASAFLIPPRLSGLAGRAAAAPSGFRMPELVGWAFAEAVAVVGLVSVAVGGPRGPLAVYLLAAAAILWLQRPAD